MVDFYMQVLAMAFFPGVYAGIAPMAQGLAGGNQLSRAEFNVVQVKIGIVAAFVGVEDYEAVARFGR
jgi:hypothetical protein